MDDPALWFASKGMWRKKARLAVVGTRFSGKTTLINSWRNYTGEAGATLSPVVHKKIKVESQAGKLKLEKTTDVSGNQDAWGDWQDSIMDSKYVLYLVDARILAGKVDQNGRNWGRLEDDAGMIGHWLSEGGAGNRYCLLVITHIDEDPRKAEIEFGDYSALLEGQTKPLVNKLGGLGRVRTVIGSLEDRVSAHLLTGHIVNYIMQLERQR